MTIRINEADLFALLGHNGEHWTKNEWGDDQQMCLHGAIRRCSPQPGDAFLIEQVAYVQGWGTEWNDADDTTWEAVKDRILAGVEVTDEMLADTYGPQWREIVTLVRRAAMLTADEVQQLEAAWQTGGEAAWKVAWNAARGDSWGDARNAAWEAAQDAAWETAGNIASDAARLAAWALAMRDLIDDHDFTDEHYDTLTGPWASVIGPVHPDDKARRD